MCGRYTQHHDAGALQTRFSVTENALSLDGPRYNIAPSQEIAVIVAGKSQNERILEGFQWGLIPSWAKEASIGAKMINARAETVAEKPSFKVALSRRRCIIPADGFYEWDKIGPVKQPVYFRRTDGDLFGFAGLWEEWRGPDKSGPPLYTCSIITTEANQTVGRIHERMPVMLASREAEDFWLDTTVQKPADLLPLLVPYPDADMESFVVSRRVNTPANDDTDLIVAVPQNSA